MKDCVLGFLFLFGFFLQQSDCLRCWECNSKYDPNCGHPFKNTTIALADCTQRFLEHDLEATAAICRKIEQKVRGENRIIRSCGYYNPEEAGTCFSRAGTHLVFMHYCQCAGEGCNSAPAMDHPAHAMWILAILLYLFS